MKVIDCNQGGQEWLLSRLGRPTSSQAHRILTPKGLKLASGRHAYAYEIHAAAICGPSTDDDDDGGGNPWMQRGIDMEPETAAWYEFEYGVKCEEVGFCLTDDGRFGASPDRLIGDDGLAEFKNPSAAKSVGYLLGENKHEHRAQVQTQLWVTKRKYCDLVIYSPLLPPVVTRYEPEPEWIEKWEPALETFLAELKEGKERLQEMGLYYYEGVDHED